MITIEVWIIKLNESLVLGKAILLRSVGGRLFVSLVQCCQTSTFEICYSADLRLRIKYIQNHTNFTLMSKYKDLYPSDPIYEALYLNTDVARCPLAWCSWPHT